MLSSGNQLFAPLETTEKMLFGVAAAGFSGLLLAVRVRIRIRRRPVRAAPRAQDRFLATGPAAVRNPRRRSPFRRLARQDAPYTCTSVGLRVSVPGLLRQPFILEELLNRSWG